ncbi:hypothetical protein CK203_051555 [Vitis vinifera]|uniref:Endonuclease/exonuclease/phosphatase domain-containing protein n=1 Tax=Vitis vinifera TaxID=29760 RepID=A0A438GXK3_VITVI|nr:hypothetical protein CK203_051555 [Vitis vinifera]
MIRNQSVVVERKIFQVKSEDYNGGKWISITERSRGFEVSLDFGEEETGWLVEQLEKAVELEDSRGFIRKMRGKTRTHLMEICFNSSGSYMKITEYIAKRKPLVLVVPRGVNGCGWENLRKVIVSVQEISVQVGRDSKETQNKLQESKGMYRGERTYADVVAEKGTRNGAGMPGGKWARAVVCEGKGKIRDWCEVGKAIARRVGMKGMVSVTPISAYKGCFFVETARKAQWFQVRGSFTMRGEVFALRRWSPEENSVVRGKFRRGWLELRGLPFHLWDEVQLSHILQQWGRVTKVARKSLKFVDLSKVTLRVEMLPKVVLPALLEVEDGDWTYMVAVTVTGEDDGGDSIRPKSSRSKDELRSVGGCVLQKPQMVEGLRAIDRTIDCQRWMPRHRFHFSSSDSKSAKGRKEREAGPAHKGSSNGGPAISSSSKLQRPGLTAKNKVSEGLLQVSSKTKGSPVSVRRRARSGPPRFNEASSSPKRSFEGGGSLETNRDISRGKSHSRKSDLSTGLETSKLYLSEIFLCLGLLSQILFPKPLFLWLILFAVTLLLRFRWSQATLFSVWPVSISPMVYDNHRGGASCSKGVVVPLETSNQKSKDRPLLRETLSNLEVRGVSGEASFPVQEPSTLPLEGFQVEGLTPRKMVKVQSVLESLRVRIVRDNGKVWKERIGILSLRTRFIPEERRKRILELEERISSGCGLRWVVIVLMKILSWNTRGLGSRKKRRTVRRFLSTQNPDVVMLQETKREIWDRRLVSSVWKVYGPNKAMWRKDFWLELQDLHGLTFPRWCVGGDFNVIRRISEKMGDSRLTVNMRCFDEFIRESGLLDPPLRNAAFTWSNMQVDPICKRIDRIEQEGNLNLDLVSERTLRRKELEDLLLKEEGETLNNIEVISEEIVNFFGNLYSKPEGDSWKIEGIDWAPISEESAIWLDRPFSEEEVRMAVFQLNKEKAPDPDGFTIAVYQECWDVIKEDLNEGRLRKVLHETIFGSQGAFVEGRQILDAVLIANEVVDEKRRSGEEGVVFKIDFEKAYDHVEWGFLDHVLQRKGFSQKWRSWMRGCLSSSSFAILVNGNAKGWVKPLESVKWPLSYLGLPLGGNPKTIGFWDPVVERISRRLDGWKKAYLSLGGRITLIQSCLSHIPSYFLSLFKIPVSIASKIEKMQRDFLWSGAGEGKKIT